MDESVSRQAILLPGIVLPAELAYPALIEALGGRVEACAKELEVYADEEPPPDYGLETELAGILREAEAAGFERFHLVGYSGGGAISAAFAARHTDRLLSLSLLEPAWIGNEGRSERELRVQAEFDRAWELPEDELMRRFVELQLASGVEPPPPPPGPTPQWMSKRPAGIKALTAAFANYPLDLKALGAFPRPVYYALGGRSNPDYFGAMASRLGELFADYTLDVFERRHHFDPPHRAEPERLAARLRELWERASAAAPEARDDVEQPRARIDVTPGLQRRHDRGPER
jgi:pimeloyl-ACP methyl ester carboxylesterase